MDRSLPGRAFSKIDDESSNRFLKVFDRSEAHIPGTLVICSLPDAQQAIILAACVSGSNQQVCTGLGQRLRKILDWFPRSRKG